ncbi:type IVB secretion system protein IcmV [Fluoribacter dumoffii]|uniref:Intracellular multiplication protein IcmV n=1 Tax=Fluoribacter dumoffii TaxID=463 RepID=A0A377G606_9GAMM|nr:type IVB secretion system protein IcmV [Fluoribacter dumoffii]KTC92516.1 intracellular multiplication protein IcmV [Fluoribacter dumoffii NY 23]MCW8387092.1 type IVB secretion system protein IcmV [Fluoribacter dumoffii]MCW8417404.1 type IVB secretion system protein IcmV [Fluoribacter dumoffii]MCW8454755.1 type IVB secretion system protein IcmV [Fluoribacter dumoffii]MCW8461168.1 type IVB secretion system protein IcmV [Fluoribacter dumoffii]
MKKQSRIVKLFATIINVRRWFDWERMKAFTLYLGNGFKRLFIPQKATQNESFNEAVKLLNLTDENIISKQKALFRLSIIMLLAAIVILGYAGYQLFYGSIRAFLVSLIVTMIALVLAFRYHFWYFQMKNRKLGCTFNEWYRQGLLGEKK